MTVNASTRIERNDEPATIFDLTATPAGTDRALDCGNACSAKFNRGTAGGQDFRQLGRSLFRNGDDLHSDCEQQLVCASKLQQVVIESCLTKGRRGFPLRPLSFEGNARPKI